MSERTTRPIVALIAKDWRLARAPVVAMLMMSIGCYLIPLSAYWNSRLAAAELLGQLEKCAVCAVFFPAVVASALGAMAVAGERSDQTADFIAVLPVARWQIIFSKWLVAGVVICGSAVIHLAVYVWMLGLDRHVKLGRGVQDAAELASLWIPSVLALFGVAWGLGTVARGVAVCACVSIGMATCVLAIFVSKAGFAGFEWTFSAAAVDSAIGLAGLAAGTVYYLRRVAP